jgi:hypothetical protein
MSKAGTKRSILVMAFVSACVTVGGPVLPPADGESPVLENRGPHWCCG